MKKINDRVGIVIPSYRETENLSILLIQLNKVFSHAQIIIVDDSEPAIQKEIQELIKSYSRVSFIGRRKKLGRGSAIATGIKQILHDKRLTYILEMDSDLAHDPAEAREFLNKLKKDHLEVVIGSGHLPGSTNESPKVRVLISRCTHFFVRHWLGVNLTHFTSGYRLYTRAAAQFLADQKLQNSGIIALAESAYLFHKNGYKIGEVPIHVEKRTYGSSTVGLKELISSLFAVLRMKSGKS